MNKVRILRLKVGILSSEFKLRILRLKSELTQSPVALIHTLTVYAHQRPYVLVRLVTGLFSSAVSPVGANHRIGHMLFGRPAAR